MLSPPGVFAYAVDKYGEKNESTLYNVSVVPSSCGVAVFPETFVFFSCWFTPS